MKKNTTHMILQILAVIMALGLLSCGQASSGGGSSSSDDDSSTSASSVTLRIAGLAVRSASADSVSAALVPSYIRSIRVTVSATGMDTVVAEAAITSPLGVEISLDVPTGASRLFKVEALDGSGYPIYAGQTYADLGDTAITLDITITDLIEEMLNSLIQTVNSKGASLTIYDLDGYFSQNYGINNGRMRSQEMYGMIPDSAANLIQTPTAISVTDVADKTLTSSGGYLLNPTLVYDDGSSKRESIIVVYENGEWKLMGNGFKSSLSIAAFNRMTTDKYDTIAYTGGLEVKVGADTGSGISKAVITGPGLPSTGETLMKDTSTGKFNFSGTSGDEFYVLSNTNISSMPASNLTYTVSMYNYFGSLIESREEVLPYRPYMSTEINSTFFARLTGWSHDVYTLPYGSTIYFDYVKPTAYTATNLNVLFRYNSISGRDYLYRRTPLLTSTYADILTQWNYYDSADKATLAIKTTDPSFRNMYYIWEFGIGGF